jgi:hypothetical protein
MLETSVDTLKIYHQDPLVSQRLLSPGPPRGNDNH